MDILRVLSQADLEVRKKILALVLDLVNSRNIDEVRVEHDVSELCCPCVHSDTVHYIIIQCIYMYFM